jgi:hypothetical protein
VTVIISSSDLFIIMGALKSCEGVLPSDDIVSRAMKGTHDALLLAARGPKVPIPVVSTPLAAFVVENRHELAKGGAN